MRESRGFGVSAPRSADAPSVGCPQRPGESSLDLAPAQVAPEGVEACPLPPRGRSRRRVRTCRAPRAAPHPTRRSHARRSGRAPACARWRRARGRPSPTRPCPRRGSTAPKRSTEPEARGERLCNGRGHRNAAVPRGGRREVGEVELVEVRAVARRELGALERAEEAPVAARRVGVGRGELLADLVELAHRARVVVLVVRAEEALGEPDERARREGEWHHDLLPRGRAQGDGALLVSPGGPPRRRAGGASPRRRWRRRPRRRSAGRGRRQTWEHLRSWGRRSMRSEGVAMRGSYARRCRWTIATLPRRFPRWRRRVSPSPRRSLW